MKIAFVKPDPEFSLAMDEMQIEHGRKNYRPSVAELGQGLRRSRTVATACCLAAFGVFLIASASPAQNFTITSSVISSGGGTSTNGSYSVTGTIGQPDAGAKMSGGNFSVEGGFWQAITLVQMPGAPLLQITRNGTQAAIFWDTATTGFILESTASLSAPVNWQSVGGVANNSVNVPATTGTLFFRLRKP
jgi:hypothetical protein